MRVVTLMGPALGAVVLAFAASGAQRRLRPAVAAWTITILAVLASTAAAAGAAVVSMPWIVRLPWLADRIGWCRSFASTHDAPPAWLGVAASGALAAMIGAGARALWLDRRMRRLAAPPGVSLLASEQPVAYAAPGGAITVSTGMLSRLDADERRALFAHERSHVRHHHHRFLRTVEVAAAAFPLVGPLRDRVRYATERWADEDAARHVGDRLVVARALARAALATLDEPLPNLALAEFGVVERVEAMVDGDVTASGPSTPGVVAGAMAVVGGLTGSGVQLHHLVGLAGHVCGL